MADTISTAHDISGVEVVSILNWTESMTVITTRAIEIVSAICRTELIVYIMGCRDCVRHTTNRDVAVTA